MAATANMRRNSVLLAFMIAGCSAPPAPTPVRDSNNDDIVRARLDALEKDVRQLRDDAFRQVELTLGDQGYSSIETDIGGLTFSLVSVDNLGDGSKAVLKIGNPTSATITRLSGVLTYGPKDRKGEKLEMWDQKFEPGLKPGVFTTVTVPLTSLPPSKIGRVAFSSVTVGSVTLFTQ